MQILPEPYAMKLNSIKEFMQGNLETEDTRYKGFKDYEVQRLERDIAWMREPLDAEYINKQQADFYRFFNESDKRHDKDFLHSFPEMKEFWNECKYYANL